MGSYDDERLLPCFGRVQPPQYFYREIGDFRCGITRSVLPGSACLIEADYG